VGPFSVSTPALVTAALEGGAHYLDVSADQAEALWLSQHPAARNANVALVPGFAFNGGLADLLTTLVVGDDQDVEDIEIGYRVMGWQPPSGSFETRMENLEMPWFTYDNRQLRQEQQWPGTRWFEFAPPLGRRRMTAYPLNDVVIASWHVPAVRMSSWVTVETLAPRFLGPFLPWIIRCARRLVHSPARALVAALLKVTWGSSTTQDTDATSFVVSVRARSPKGERRAEVSGRGIYDLSAMMVSDAAIHLMEGGQRLVGVRAPAELLEARTYIDRLSAYGVTSTGILHRSGP
jgi:short subunit dehydrogenase-like uncharacterized protein